MHYLTSNFNLLYSNSLWGPLKNQGVKIDNDFDSYFVNLINNQNIKKYNSFHIVIFLDKSGYQQQKSLLDGIPNVERFIEKKYSFHEYYLNNWVIYKKN